MVLRKRGTVEEEAAAAYRPCQHVVDYRAKHGARGFRVLQRCINGGALGRASLRKEEKEVPHCIACRRASGRLYACLFCAAIGCWAPISPRDVPHALAHAQAKPDHNLAIDVERAELFCCICRDQVYDPDFDRAVICAQSVAFRSQNKRLTNGDDVELLKGPDTRSKRRKHAQYRPWVPTPTEQNLLTKRSTPLHDDPLLPWGLRGMNNLGNTCFMNSVLQALLHTPPLRNYFLSDRHNRGFCQQKGPHLCLGCDMDTIYSAAFSGDHSPYSPARFLYSWWQHAANLAGYEQQDAHEFFISAVDGIHANLANPYVAEGNKSAGDGDCQCIAHRVFSGLLRSDVTCTVCGFSSTTYDPCIDISLDLEPAPGASKVQPYFNLSNGGERSSGGAQVAKSTGLGTSLYGCLDRYTRSERLGSNEKFYCQNCKVPQESVKQMSIRKMPLVLCLHIKRFEHSSICNMSRKIDRYVQFPFFLDMAPYLSSSIVRSRHGNRLLCIDGEEADSTVACMSPAEFELFAVVTHSGKLDSGHYITYLRLGGLWYRCDDSWVSKVSEDVVRASQVYMLYYVQKTFSYQASEQWPVKDGFATLNCNGIHTDVGSCFSNGLLS